MISASVARRSRNSRKLCTPKPHWLGNDIGVHRATYRHPTVLTELRILAVLGKIIMHLNRNTLKKYPAHISSRQPIFILDK